MTFQFTNKPIASGFYEPEGIYLTPPFKDKAIVIQSWGDHPDFYANYKYNGIALRGYIGIGFDLSENTQLLATDTGKVTEIGIEPYGFGRYIKLEHSWGESLYACISLPQVDTVQSVVRGDLIALSGKVQTLSQPRFHFGIRLNPYNRFDGWGGFSDPMPYLDPATFKAVNSIKEEQGLSEEMLLPMAVELPNMRRP